MVFPNIIWNGNKLDRRIPSCLDVAFSVLKNNDIVPDLVKRMTQTDGRLFRDNLPYQHNLAAVREVVERQPIEYWDGSIYLRWLAALRTLSEPTTSSEYPQSMRTRAWAMKNLNSQLASWTHMRHATILYAKQSYTGGLICSYPYGFVEPRPAFWESMQTLAAYTASKLYELLPVGKSITNDFSVNGRPLTISIDSVIENQSSHLVNFSNAMKKLCAIAKKELSQTPLDSTETQFLKTVVEQKTEGGCVTTRYYTGWYHNLYRRSVVFNGGYMDYSWVWDSYLGGNIEKGPNKWDAQVVDVHTDIPNPDSGDPGCVLHEGVGNVNLMVIAIDNGTDRMIYAGPVLSHYEFEMPAFVRKTDAEWKNDLTNKKQPPVPEWTKGYLVPK